MSGSPPREDTGCAPALRASHSRPLTTRGNLVRQISHQGAPPGSHAARDPADTKLNPSTRESTQSHRPNVSGRRPLRRHRATTSARRRTPPSVSSRHSPYGHVAPVIMPCSRWADVEWSIEARSRVTALGVACDAARTAGVHVWRFCSSGCACRRCVCRAWQRLVESSEVVYGPTAACVTPRSGRSMPQSPERRRGSP
jgi:hypothetical protein